MSKNPRLIDLAGKRFGLWLVLDQAGNTPRGAAIWRAACDCGAIGFPTGINLRSGQSRSCGCAADKATGDRSRKHGRKGTRLHRIWSNMRRRCFSPATPGWKNYGGRGITVCAEWSEFSAFEEWAITHGYGDALSIERIDVNGNYCEENCTWADSQTQNENRRFVQRAPDGRLWWHVAQQHGISQSAYRSRLCDGWAVEDAATWPQGKRRVERVRDTSGKFA